MTTIMTDEKKQCICCNDYHSIDDFAFYDKEKTKRRNQCKTCRRLGKKTDNQSIIDKIQRMKEEKVYGEKTKITPPPEIPTFQENFEEDIPPAFTSTVEDEMKHCKMTNFCKHVECIRYRKIIGNDKKMTWDVESLKERCINNCLHSAYEYYLWENNLVLNPLGTEKRKI